MSGISSKRNVIILVAVLVIVIVGGVIAAVAVSSSDRTDIAETLTLAQRYLDEEEYERAIIEFDKIIEIEPMNAEAYLGKAQALVALGDIDGAIELLETAYELTGDEDIRVVLEELKETAQTAETTSATTTTAVPELMEEVWNDPECLAIEQMLYDYFNNGGELDEDLLADVTELVIYGKDCFSISIGNKRGTYIDLKGFRTFESVNVKLADGSTIVTEWGYINDVSFLQSFCNLQYFEIQGNYIRDISSLKNCTSIQTLYISSNYIEDISAIADMEQLEALFMYRNLIRDQEQQMQHIIDSLPNCWINYT